MSPPLHAIPAAPRPGDPRVAQHRGRPARPRPAAPQGRTILDLTVGEPDFDTPDHVKAAAHRPPSTRGDTKYTPVNGIPALREAIAAEAPRAAPGSTYAGDEIAVGGGAKQIIFLALMATVDAGDEVDHPGPVLGLLPGHGARQRRHPGHRPLPRGRRLQAHRRRARAGDHRRAPAGSSSTRRATRPAPPTRRDELRALAEVLLAPSAGLVLTDEIYDEIWYRPGHAAQPAAVDAAAGRPGPARQRRLQDVRHDRLAHRLRRGATRADRGHQHAASPDLVLPVLDQPGRCRRRADRRPGLRPPTASAVYRGRRDLPSSCSTTSPAWSLRPPGRRVLPLRQLCRPASVAPPRTGHVEHRPGRRRCTCSRRRRSPPIQAPRTGRRPYFRFSFATSSDVLDARPVARIGASAVSAPTSA